MSLEFLHSEVQRILNGGRPMDRSDRMAWIKDTIAALEIGPIVAGFALSHFGSADIETLDDAQLARLQRFVKNCADVEIECRARPQ
ncbi:MAG: hypothetical protein NXI21_01970 [Alphaproteobacteria bacterium]|nr:hypothetical protein [Alphaproteobacteria bacterium]